MQICLLQENEYVCWQVYKIDMQMQSESMFVTISLKSSDFLFIIQTTDYWVQVPDVEHSFVTKLVVCIPANQTDHGISIYYTYSIMPSTLHMWCETRFSVHTADWLLIQHSRSSLITINVTVFLWAVHTRHTLIRMQALVWIRNGCANGTKALAFFCLQVVPAHLREILNKTWLHKTSLSIV